jgi:hypothetical protein
MLGTTLRDPSGQSYELLRLLGSGGFGEVYLARTSHPSGVRRLVAVKWLHPGVEPQAAARLRDEATLLASLRHPALLAAEALVELGGRLALVTEYVEGQDLAACLGDGLPPSTLVEALSQVAWALHEAWTKAGVVHRDVKPSNIRIGVHGNVKLLDFGIARSDLVSREASSTRGLVGTLPYLAPERFEPGTRPHLASDVFSLGCVLLEGLTSSSFYGDLDLPQIAALALSSDDRWERHLTERLSQAPHAELLRAMLARDPGARPTAAEVGERGQALLARDPGHVPLQQWCRRRQWPEEALAPVPATVWSQDRHLEPPRAPWTELALLGGGVVFALLVGAAALWPAPPPEEPAPVEPIEMVELPVEPVELPVEPLPPQPAPVELPPEPPPCPDPEACYALAHLHAEGLGKPEDDLTANRLFALACEGGHMPACHALAEQYTQEQGTPGMTALTGGNREACRLHQRACDHDFLESCYSYGVMQFMSACSPDGALALAPLKKACEGGHMRACVWWGDMYTGGHFLAENDGEANRLYALACEAGVARGCAELAEQHAHGEGTPKDESQASQLWKRACELGDTDACEGHAP